MGVDIDQGLNELLADYTEKATGEARFSDDYTDEQFHPSPGVNAELQERALARDELEDQEAQAEQDDLATIRAWEIAPDGGFMIERTDGRIEQYAAGTDAYPELAQKASELAAAHQDEQANLMAEVVDGAMADPESVDDWNEIRAYMSMLAAHAEGRELEQTDAAEEEQVERFLAAVERDGYDPELALEELNDHGDYTLAAERVRMAGKLNPSSLDEATDAWLGAGEVERDRARVDEAMAAELDSLERVLPNANPEAWAALRGGGLDFGTSLVIYQQLNETGIEMLVDGTLDPAEILDNL